MKIREGNYTFSFDFLKNSSLLIDQIVRFIPLSLTVKISKDNPCDTNNIYRANWTKMMKEGRDLLLGTSLSLPPPLERGCKGRILAENAGRIVCKVV